LYHKLKNKNMKKLFLSFGLALMTTFAVNAQNVATPTPAAVPVLSKANIVIDKEMHDYGSIENGANGTCEFTITNTGTEDLIVENAKGSCGCTVPDWPKAPIKPGKSAVMSVKYDTKRTGPINKSVTITCNASNAPTTVVRIKGDVKAPVGEVGAPVVAPSLGAPVNK
jgi:Protein of unknown function (DUF1573)